EVEEQNRREDGADEDRAREHAELPQAERGGVLLVDMRQVEELELDDAVGGARDPAPRRNRDEERDRARGAPEAIELEELLHLLVLVDRVAARGLVESRGHAERG